MERAIDAEGREVAARLAEKGGELGPIHLACCHRERTMMDRAKAAHMAIDRQIVGRHRGMFVAQQRPEGLGIERVAAQDAMATEDPQIAELAERRPGCNLGYRVSAGSLPVSGRSSSEAIRRSISATSKPVIVTS